MFCTFKAGNGAGEPFDFEATPPPFAKKREGKMSKVACINCRISKLRCSGDPVCCWRCSSKKFECEYPSPPRSNSQSQGPSPPLTAITDSAIGRIDSPHGTTPFNGHLPDSIHDFGLLDLPTSGAASLTDDGTNDHIAQELEALGHRQQMSTDRNYTFGSGLTDIDDMFASPVSLGTPKASNTSIRLPCSCLQQAMSANEAIEIIMWGQKDLCSDVYDLLQQQKAALAKCEDLLLDCQTCCIQPPFVMLLLSMCRKLLATLDKVCQGPFEVEDSGLGMPMDGSTDQRKRRRMGYESSGVESRPSYGISIRERRLDDDDESLVLRSLVTIRVKMLKRIIVRLDEVVSQYNWPVHKGVCRELQSALSAGSFT